MKLVLCEMNLKYRLFKWIVLFHIKYVSAVSNVDRYRAYDSTFSSYVEDIEKEIEQKLVYFDGNGINVIIILGHLPCQLCKKSCLS